MMFPPQAESRYIFRGHAIPLAGHIRRPRDFHIPPVAATAIPSTGGRAEARISRQNVEDLLTIEDAFSAVDGDYEDTAEAIRFTHGNHAGNRLPTRTVVHCGVRGLRIIVRGPSSTHTLTVDDIELKLTSRGRLPGVSGNAITIDRATFDGLTLDGRRLSVNLRVRIFSEHDTKEKLSWAYESDEGFFREYGHLFLIPGADGPYTARQKRRIPEAHGTIMCTIATRLEWAGDPHPEVRIDGHRIVFPDFGVIYLGEAAITENSRRVTMMRIHFGSPDGGEASIVECEAAGNAWPFESAPQPPRFQIREPRLAPPATEAPRSPRIGPGGEAAAEPAGAAGGSAARTEEFPAAGERKQDREITVTGHDMTGRSVRRFERGGAYRLRFGVGARNGLNLASGDVAVREVPQGGMRTHWVVTSRDVEFVPQLSTCKAETTGGTWRAEFELDIPETGKSDTRDLAVVIGEKPGDLLVTIYAVSASGGRELYREVSVSLSGKPSVTADEICKAPGHTHLRTTHEWTTPPEHIQVSIKNGVAETSTKRHRLALYEFSEPFAATDNLLAGPIQNVRSSLERLREVHEAYLDDLDHADIAARLSSYAWTPDSTRVNGWQPLPDHSDAAHRQAFAQVQQGQEWRDLASDGYALFDACFPQGTRLRASLETLLPGSRIDFHWTEQSGSGWVSHVPWPLMYMEPVDVTGQTPADPEKFLGLRFRIGSRSWSVNNGSVVLGDLGAASTMHLIYWGDKTGDEVAVEARWQASELARWKKRILLPDPSKANFKQQIVLALDNPGPSPVALLYLYCHCSVGDGAQPCLRFGNTSKREDTLGRNDLSRRSIPDGPLVFANACTTAQADPHMTSELEQSFFRRGVRAFIGTETKVPIRLASKFAWLYFQFFFRMVDPDPMAAGEALTQARMFLWTQYKNVGGLFYSMANQYDLYLASEQEVLALRR